LKREYKSAGDQLSKKAMSILDAKDKIKEIDKSCMLSFCVDSAAHYLKAAKMTENILLPHSEPDNIIVAGMGGSAIGGELLKDWARDKARVPIEVCSGYTLPAYANNKSLTLMVSYSGETEEALSAFLDALRKNCMIFCISSGGKILEFAEKLDVPCFRVPSGMPPRAALPYLFVPLLKALEKVGIVSGVSAELSETIKLLADVSDKNAPEKSVEDNLAKFLAGRLNGNVPLVYGFGVYRSVAQRLKQQFNENSKVPAKWEIFPELNHNEIVGWENAGKLAKCFYTILIRDKNEPTEIRNRIETTKTLLHSDSKLFEMWAQGKSDLARMLSTVCMGDFTSIYLAILRGVDPTPVNTIALLKEKMKRDGMKEIIIRELEMLVGSR
jgi:glucose/mannose-6-phosphate isomerase